MNHHDDKPLLIPVPFDPLHVAHGDTTEPMTVEQIVTKVHKSHRDDIDGTDGCDIAIQEAITAINALNERAVTEARDSEKNQLFSIMRFLGIPHNAAMINRVQDGWKATAKKEADRISQLKKGTQ